MVATTSERSARIRESFNSYRPGREEILARLYHPNVHFADPLDETRGLEALTKYYQNIYQSVQSIRFDFSSEAIAEDCHLCVWKMVLVTPKLNSGREIVLPGVSEIRFDPGTNLVIYHRDYYDLGAMLYEHLPILGTIIKTIKNRAR